MIKYCDYCGAVCDEDIRECTQCKRTVFLTPDEIIRELIRDRSTYHEDMEARISEAVTEHLNNCEECKAGHPVEVFADGLRMHIHSGSGVICTNQEKKYQEHCDECNSSHPAVEPCDAQRRQRR